MNRKDHETFKMVKMLIAYLSVFNYNKIVPVGHRVLIFKPKRMCRNEKLI